MEASKIIIDTVLEKCELSGIWKHPTIRIFLHWK
jgi:hypothetical protein